MNDHDRQAENLKKLDQKLSPEQALAMRPAPRAYTSDQLDDGPAFPVLPAAPIEQQAQQAMDDDLETPEFSDLDLAEQFAQRADGVLRWSCGVEWMFNTGSHWQRDDGLRRFTHVKAVARSAAAAAEKPALKAKLCSAATAAAVLGLARSEPGIITPVEEWDKSTDLLNTAGAVYDLRTGQPVPRDGHLFTQVAAVAPSPMPTPVWNKFLADVFDNDVAMLKFVQRLAGYCLSGSTKEQKLFFLWGEGANGKSVLLDTFKSIWGVYAHNLPSEALMTSKHERHPTTLAALQGKRLAISSEIEESSPDISP